MSAGEVVGLTLTAALMGGVCGGVFVARWCAASRHAVLEVRRIDALVRRLDAHAELSRATLSFVKAFRSLATEPRDSAVFTKRRGAARKAQRRWRRARHAFSLAEAALTAWNQGPLDAEPMIRSFPCAEEIRRIALRGTQEEMDALFRRIHEADRRAMECVRREQWARPRVASVGRSLLNWAERMVTRVVRSWDRPDR